MEVVIQQDLSLTGKGACLVLACHEQGQLGSYAKWVDQQSGGALSHFLATGDFTGEPGQCQLLYALPGLPYERLLLVGVGSGERLREEDLRKSAQALGRAVAHAKLPELSLAVLDIPVAHRTATESAEIWLRGILDAQYRFDHYKKPAKHPYRALERITLIASEASAELQESIHLATSIARASHWARDLANEPGNICTPTWLAEQAQQMATRLGLGCEILGPLEMEELGMNLLLGVAQGSRQEPRLIVLRYLGGAKDEKPIVLVGKGLTFDAGGISLKPADKMDEMKYDMCGGASALAAIQAAAELKLPLNIVAIVPASENLPDGKATKPGDIHRSMNGLSVEILNTDAEGRLILADALTYAERFDPDVVIDMATLTGACIIALGHQTAAVLGNHEGLIHDLLAAGRKAQDRAWELPLFPEYQEQLKSPFADLSNVGGRPAGTITAACFLSRFAESYRWAHLDIAGVAWQSGEQKGATGRPVPLLVHYLRHRAKSKS
ncbi:MAG: leucyl aminopeptidase [Acidithiobacillus sp.]|nr:leucyl aminopeptidase [Acidithiobacillus sp.]